MMKDFRCECGGKCVYLHSGDKPDNEHVICLICNKKYHTDGFIGGVFR